MSPPPDVSVVIATYNSSRTLRCALASALAQVGPSLEVLVIGDACTDDTAEVIASFGDPRVTYHNRAANSGSQATPNNDGVRRARGRFIALLGHDDLWFPWHLAELVGAIEARSLDLVYGLTVWLGPHGVLARGRPPAVGPHPEHFAPPSSWLYHRDLVDRIGEWADADSIARPVDTDYLQRAAAVAAVGRHPRLSLIKCGSRYFRTYDPSSVLPQAALWERLQADPERVEHELLSELAACWSDFACPYCETGPAALKTSIIKSRAALRALLFRLPGGQRLHCAWFQAARRRARGPRGLSPR